MSCENCGSCRPPGQGDAAVKGIVPIGGVVEVFQGDVVVQERLARAHVAVFGLGGVGGYAAEALVRSGVAARPWMAAADCSRGRSGSSRYTGVFLSKAAAMGRKGVSPKRQHRPDRAGPGDPGAD